MSGADLRYLLRYVFIILIAYSAITLLRLALKEFGWAIRHAMRPARGYFLLTNPRRKLRKINRPKKRSWFASRKDEPAQNLDDIFDEYGVGQTEETEDNTVEEWSLFQRFKQRFKHEFSLKPKYAYAGAGLIEYRTYPGEDFQAKTQQKMPYLAWQDSRDSTDDFTLGMDNAPLYYRESGSPQPNRGAEELLGKDAAVMALPLYPTTLMGRSKRSDIRLNTDEVAKRHCTIYRYDGNWFILPNHAGNLVRINGANITESTELKNRDQLQIGDLLFIFVDERTEAREQGIDYEGAAIDDAYFLEAVKLTSRQPHDVFLAMNLFCLLGAAVIVFFLPEAFVPKRMWIAGCFGACLGLLDLYYLFLPKILGYADRLILVSAGFLMSFGLILQARLAFFGNPYFVDQMATGDPQAMADVTELMFRRFLFHGAANFAGILILWLVALLVSRTRLMENLVWFCFIATPALLLASKILGRDQFGASLRIHIGPIAIQPTEYVKLTYLVVLANFFKNRPPLKQQFFFAVWAAVNFILILSLPDLGSIMILLPTTIIVFAVMTSDYFKTFLVLGASAVLGVVGYMLFPHVQQRLSGWTSLFSEVNDANVQIVYGLQAVARGGLTGRGIGNGNPWGIPLFNSDMIYSILFEEFGLIVGLCVLIFYIVFWFRSARLTAISRDGFAAALSLGLGTAFFMESVVVIGGTMGLIPLTGATLPFIALGANSLLAKWVLVALLVGLSARHEQGANR